MYHKNQSSNDTQVQQVGHKRPRQAKQKKKKKVTAAFIQGFPLKREKSVNEKEEGCQNTHKNPAPTFDPWFCTSVAFCTIYTSTPPNVPGQAFPLSPRVVCSIHIFRAPTEFSFGRHALERRVYQRDRGPRYSHPQQSHYDYCTAPFKSYNNTLSCNTCGDDRRLFVHDLIDSHTRVTLLFCKTGAYLRSRGFPSIVSPYLLIVFYRLQVLLILLLPFMMVYFPYFFHVNTRYIWYFIFVQSTGVSRSF